MTKFFVAAVVAVLIIWFVASYNRLIRGMNRVEEAFSTMDVYLKKRFDLVPNLVETVKEYAKHESETLERVIEARKSAENSMNIEERAQLETELSGALRKVFAVSERYPDLKANTGFLDLQEQLQSIEEDIANSRKYYNAVVRNYNNDVMVIPTNLIAAMFHFEKATMFEVMDEVERENVKVNFR